MTGAATFPVRIGVCLGRFFVMGRKTVLLDWWLVIHHILGWTIGNDFSSPKVGGWELTQSRENARGAWRSTPSARHSSECPSHGLVHGYCELHMLTDALGLLGVLIWFYEWCVCIYVNMCIYIYRYTLQIHHDMMYLYSKYILIESYRHMKLDVHEHFIFSIDWLSKGWMMYCYVGSKKHERSQ